MTLQQILFYRELGFELKQIKHVLGRADFEKSLPGDRIGRCWISTLI
ncbi:MAG TPA: hypothetical protein VKU02_07315 [Gemmataceae bacterium]|nr:hypothetical protein [Gemmataceae bacterium]